MKQKPTLHYEQQLWSQGFTHVAGIDEVGRGCLAGPIVVGAVVFEPMVQLIDEVQDSKLLTPKHRESLAAEIKNSALNYAIGVGSVEHINNHGIMSALRFAINAALTQLPKSDQLLIDGRPLTTVEYSWPPAEYIIKGDQHVYSIAAASIIAKVYRDELMKKLAVDFPQYGWERNVGYGTAEHQSNLLIHGACLHHRQLFLRKILPAT